MSAMNHVPIPDPLRDEFVAAREEDIEDLKFDAHALLTAGKPKEEVEARMISSGWSRTFAGWFIDQVKRYGPDLNIFIPKQTQYESALEEWTVQKGLKDDLAKNGGYLMLGAFALRLLAVFALQGGAGLGYIVPVLWLATFIMFFAGAAKVARSKGHSANWAIIGIFVYLLSDKNRLPLKPEKASFKAEAQMFSNW